MINLYPYFGLPKNWREPALEELVQANIMRRDVYEKLILKLDQINTFEGVKIFVQGNVGVIANYLTRKLDIPLTKIQGIDFIEHFKGAFSKDNFEVPLDKRIIFLYNVGMEGAINKDYSSKILGALIQQLLDNGAVIFLQSNTSYSKFFLEYNIEFTNTLNIGYLKEKTF